LPPRLNDPNSPPFSFSVFFFFPLG
jgi:hypothetical protein